MLFKGEAMLELQQLAKDWDARALLCDVNLRVASGETVAILGPSGSGKSTLLKIVAGLEPLDAGRVLFDGQDITRLAPERRRFALMFQDFALFPHLSMVTTCGFGRSGRACARPSAPARAVDLMRFGLTAHGGARVWTLSGGEQQRSAGARADPSHAPCCWTNLFRPRRRAARLRAEFKERITETGMTAIW
jgi:ABC-type Fe3+/spermidine/putrescine transport system ATPase subunit